MLRIPESDRHDIQEDGPTGLPALWGSQGRIHRDDLVLEEVPALNALVQQDPEPGDREVRMQSRREESDPEEDLFLKKTKSPPTCNTSSGNLGGLKGSEEGGVG